MTLITLIVKGTREAAMASAEAHGFNAEWMQENMHGEQVLRTLADPPEGALAAWFAEKPQKVYQPPNARGYPPRTLLWFRFPEKGAPRTGEERLRIC